MEIQNHETLFCGNLADLPVALRVKDLSHILGIGRNSAYRLISEGRIQSLRVGNRIVIPRAALIKFLNGSIA